MTKGEREEAETERNDSILCDYCYFILNSWKCMNGLKCEC